MKYIALLFLLTFSTALPAQAAFDNYVYCEAQAVCIGFGTDFALFVDLGIQTVGPLKSQIMVRDLNSGKRRNFNSRIHTLNFMLNRGWELVETYAEGESTTPVFLLRYPLNGQEMETFLVNEARDLYGEAQ